MSVCVTKGKNEFKRKLCRPNAQLSGYFFHARGIQPGYFDVEFLSEESNDKIQLDRGIQNS